MRQPRAVSNWFVGQRVLAIEVDGIVPPGKGGTVRRFDRETDSLIVLFDGERDVCLVGGEEVEPADTWGRREHVVGDVSF